MTTMNQQSIESQICDAVQILAERAIEQARYDKTISALIVECVDTKKGKYKVKYQDSFFYATSDNIELNYRKNTEVYVLVPEGDFAKNKKILGTVKDMGEEYAQRMEELNNTYYEVGNSVIWEGGNLCSYKLEDEKIYTDFQVDSSFNDNIRQYGSKLRLSADIQTALPPGHRGKGTYGITAALNFTEEETGKPITHTFTLDIDSMIGDPYSFGNPMRQKLDFEINDSKFNYIEYFKIYSKNFVKPEESREDKADNIFISNIQLVSLANKDKGYIKIYAEDGYTFEEEKTELTFKAVPMIGNKEIANENIKFYWFSEDGSIDETNEHYSPIGGKGWYWLNPDSLTDTLKIVEEEQLAQNLQYLCIAVLDNEKYEETFNVVNKNAVYSVEVVSINNTTEFIHDRGKTTLICRVNDSDTPEGVYSYYWSKIDNVGNSVALSLDNGDSQQILNITNLSARQYLMSITNENSTKKFSVAGNNKTILDNLGIAYKNLSNEEVYKNVQNYLIENGLTCIINNTFYDVRAKNIITSAFYKCTVKNSLDKVVGTASIELRNIRLSQNNYTLKINNGTQVFKYDINGRAPRDTVNEKALIPKELSVSLYDSKGNEIQEDYEIRWKAPIEKTLIETNDLTKPTLNFNLKQNYNNKYVNNDIEVEVIYKGESIRATTDFTFIKEGFSGTNGTDYYCKIVPKNGDFIDGYTFITYYQGSKKAYLNTNGERTELDKSNPFTVYLYDNGVKIESPSKITWRLLNKENKTTDFSPLEIANGKLNIITSKLTNITGNYIGVIQAEVDYDNKKFFAELPIGLVVMKPGYDNYILEIEEGTGFNEVIYTSDGTNPQYNSGADFTIYAEAAPDDTGFKENITHTLTTKNWTGKNNELTLKINVDKSCKVTPIKQYNGLSSDIFVKCETEIGTIYFPILFRLNRYGFSALNDWDGKGIEINNDKNYIMTPQIGAGKKDPDNGFTGVLMGLMKEANSTSKDEKVGLLGFNNGERTIFLDAKSGDAHFGKQTGSAQISLYGSTGIAEFKGAGGSIVLDPSKSDEGAVIKSDNYSESNGTGLKINFSKPYIKFGSGNFEVNSLGKITAKEAVIEGTLTAGANSKIGPWTVSTTAIYKNGGYNSSTAGSAYFGSDGLSVLNKFRVDANGILNASGATISGTLTAGSGSEIGGWTITDNTIQSGNIILNSYNNTIKAGSNFSVNNNGTITATGGTFTNITATGGTFTNIKVTGSSSFSGSLSGATGSFSGSLSGATGNFSGTITAGGGSKIGDWIIEDGEIKSSAKNIRLISGGSNPRIICGETSLFDGGTVRTPYVEIHPRKGMRVRNGSTYYDCPEKVEIIVTDRSSGGSKVCKLTFRRGLLVSRTLLE